MIITLLCSVGLRFGDGFEVLGTEVFHLNEVFHLKRSWSLLVLLEVKTVVSWY